MLRSYSLPCISGRNLTLGQRTEEPDPRVGKGRAYRLYHGNSPQISMRGDKGNAHVFLRNGKEIKQRIIHHPQKMDGSHLSVNVKSKVINENTAMSIEPLMVKGAEVSSNLQRQDKLSDFVCKPNDVVGVVESFFSDDPVKLDSVQRKRNAAEEIIKNGTLLLGENHQQSDSRVVLLDLIAGGKINKLLLEIPDYNLRARFVEMKGKTLENFAEWDATKDLIDSLVGSSETANRVKMSDLIHSALAKGIDVYPMDLACGVGGHRQAMRRRNIHMGDVYKTAATANEPGVAVLVGDDHLKTFPAQAASGFMRGQQEVPSLTDCCSLSPEQVLRLDSGEI